MIATSSQNTPGVEGYVFDGTDGQRGLLDRRRDAATAEHVDEFDEWFVVVRIAGRVTAGTRTVRALGGRRAERRPA